MTLRRLWTLVALLLIAGSAAAERHNRHGEERGRPVMSTQTNAKWQAECGGCHLAFPPGMLPAPSWQKLMGGLDKHFGTDASLSAADTQEITGFLTKNASTRNNTGSDTIKITETTWFKSKHRAGEINPAVWKRESVKSPANCIACHRSAEKGDFDEDKVRIPK